ncbi:hypothetical protein ACLOJK_000142 [Asimina triloba]
MEDNEPAAKWVFLINQKLNQTESPQLADTLNSPSTQSSCISSFSYRDSRPRVLLCPKGSKTCNTLPCFHWPSLKTVGQNFTTKNGKQVKMCNCSLRAGRNLKDLCFLCQQGCTREVGQSSDDESSSRPLILRTDIPISNASNPDQMKYRLIVTKQMVGIFVSIWVQRELVQHVGHIRLSRVGRGILGCLGNKGCIAVSMSVHQTTFCFVCSHLASGEKEGDELRRNSDVIDILKNTQFPKIYNMTGSRIPEKILEHDRVIWLGDLNYRIALSYAETRKLLEQNDWGALLEKDQLKIELEAGRVFKGWKEGKIFFAPTYKYSYNSDTYAGETPATRKKRRTPAWCDRILWYGDGIEQLCYIRIESRLSDHRPVCAVFRVEVSMMEPESAQRLPDRSEIEINVQELLPLNTELSDVTHL